MNIIELKDCTLKAEY